MNYYFAGWDEDAEDIFALMEEWWGDIREGYITIDKEAFHQLHYSGKLLSICARSEAGELIACFIGIIVPDLYHKGNLRLEQLAACFSKQHRDGRNFLKMLGIVEKISKKLKINSVSFGVVETRMAEIMKKKGYALDVVSMIKEIQ